MYRNKKDVDKYVENLVSKLTVKEFRSRAYSVARLYFEVGDYSSCQKYVEQYLTQKDNNAAAHKLLGQTLQKMGEKEKALEQYKFSLDIDATQTSLVLEICELLSDDDIAIDPGRAKYWCEKAESIFPKHPVTFRLRERLLSLSNKDPETLSKLLIAELEARPKDALIHCRLIRHYIEVNKIKEAFDHSLNMEIGENAFSNNYHWYETLAEILKHNSNNINDWVYQLLLLTVRERICALSLTETPSGTSRSLVESNELLHMYDQAIDCVVKAGSLSGFGDFHVALVNHHKGQLAYHAATFLLKKAKKDQLSWREATKIAAPLMLIAWHTSPVDPNANVFSSPTPSSDKQSKALFRWYLEGAYRCSQAGHYLLSNVQEKCQALLDQISQCCFGTHWRDKIYEKIFISRDHLAKIKTSYLASNAFHAPILRLPRKNEVESYDNHSQRMFPSSLHHIVWILLQYKNYAQFKCTLFNKLTSTTSSGNCGPETLNKLDVHAFLYCATLTAQNKTSNSLVFGDKPVILPANITDLKCSLPQMKWWDCAYKFSQHELGSELTDIRATLSRGIEVVRCVDNHGLDPHLLYLLGGIFKEQAKLLGDVDEKSNTEIRAGLFYSSAIPLLERLKNHINIKLPEKRLFDYMHKELSNLELNTMLEECKVHVAVDFLKDCEYEKAIEMLSKLKSPRAYYHISQTYKTMALDGNNSHDMTNAEMKSKYCSLLTKAKHFAYKTLDKLKDDDINKNHPLYFNTQELIEDIEMNINKMETDHSVSAVGNINGRRYSSDGNTSPVESEQTLSRIHSNVFNKFSSTPKPTSNVNTTNYRTAVDLQLYDETRVDQQCLERIENQIQNLQKQDVTTNNFMEQTKDWFEENRKLSNQIINSLQSNIQNTTEQFKLLKLSVDQVRDQIDECKNECKDVGELKKQIAELKSEVNKMKKCSSEQAITDSDLYNLDENFRTNDSTSNFIPQLPFPHSHVIPPFSSRLVPQFPIPPNPYQVYGQNLYNFYNQYSQLIQPPVPGGTPLFDSNRPQMNFPNVYPTPDQMYLDIANHIPTSVHPVSSVPSVPGVPSAPTAPTVPAMSIAPTIPITVPSHTLPVMTTKNNSTSELKDDKKALPVNVVITSSDPLPTCTTAPLPVLSVTIPTKHIKNTVHNYQITMPSANEAKTTTPLFSFANKLNESVNLNPSPVINWNRNPVFNSASSSSTKIFGDSPKETLNTDKFESSKTVVDGVYYGMSPDKSLNKSRTISEKSNASVENYDPCPDFKPIIPLPAEVKVTTGEEDETVVFSARAKLFRFVDKQWKERGLGEIKLLKHKVSGKVRVLMRREQIHKICANHIITFDMEIKPMRNETKAYFWVANDFADETVVLEKFSARFKTTDIALQFFNTFEKARQECSANSEILAKSENQSKSELVSNEVTPTNFVTAKPIAFGTVAQQLPSDSAKTMIGGFTFSNTPTFKTVSENDKIDTSTDTATSKANVFSNLSFKTNTSPKFSSLFNNSSNNVINVNNEIKHQSPVKQNTSDTVDEFEPNVDFKPVIPLPALVDQKTGEEDEVILFEHRAKLLRFEASSKEWKDRGLGNIKLLVHKGNNQKIRLLMRREQVMKVCCNHAITIDMSFQKMPNVDKAVTWCAKDFSEGELIPETFCLRFKTALICDNFMDAVKTAQSKMKDESKAAKEEQNAAKQSNLLGFGDKFKAKPGSWYCQSCYTNNLEHFNKCACCEQLKPEDKNASSNNASDSNWGEKFKPKPGTWDCKNCYIRNESNVDICAACNGPKNPLVTNSENKASSNEAYKFNFGMPLQNTNGATNLTASAVNEGFGDQFKPKEGTWECKQCFIRNENSAAQCIACNNLKDSDTVKKGYSIFDTASQSKFNFGIQQPFNNEKPKSLTTSIFDGTGGHKFSFGIPSNTNEMPNMPFLDNKPTTAIFATPKAKENEASIFNMTENNESNKFTLTKQALLPTPQGNISSNTLASKEPVTFDFVFKPKNSPKGKSPAKPDKGDDSDDHEYASDDDGQHIHFSPVIPLPDKVEVVTGEENEVELYAHRAKLFRFLSSEWKERGIGVVKILKNNDTGKLRVVMRRDQVLKICLNHALTPDIIYTPKDEKTWLFTANDYSEGELSLQQFCLRFKNKDIALDFKTAIDNSRADKNVVNVAPSNKVDDKDDVVFVKEIQATVEEKQKAKELMLPENFFIYKNKEPCQGCRGCKDDSDSSETSSVVSGSVKAPAVVTTVTLSTPEKTSTPTFWSPANSMYGTPGIFNKTDDNSVFGTPVEPNNYIVKSTTASIFSRNLINEITNKENSDIQKSTIFSSSTNPNPLLEKEQNKPTTTEDEKTVTSSKSFILAAPKLANVSSSESNGNQKKTETKPLLAAKSVFNFTENKPMSEGNKNIGDEKPEVKSIFGTEFNQKASNLFTATTPGSIFGLGSLPQKAAEEGSTFSPFVTKTSESKPSFGSDILTFGNKTNQPTWNFGQNTTKSEDTNNDAKIEEKVTETKKEDDEADKKGSLFKIDNTLSFAALSSSGPGFNVQAKPDFRWEGAGQQLFLSGSKVTDKDKSNAGEEANTSGGVDEEYDPHYEPIVPLPDKIDVVTGEEDEEKMFGERCKLYRYDENSREWKERGVGEMKILYHPTRKTYRMLLRREQVHKAVLNMLVHIDLELLPLKNSDRAWTWAGINYAEKSSGEQETLAVRFKSVDLASAFKEKLTESVRKLQAVAAEEIREAKDADSKVFKSVAPLRLPKHLQDSARVDPSNSTENTQNPPLTSGVNTEESKPVIDTETGQITKPTINFETGMFRLGQSNETTEIEKQGPSVFQTSDLFKQLQTGGKTFKFGKQFNIGESGKDVTDITGNMSSQGQLTVGQDLTGEMFRQVHFQEAIEQEYQDEDYDHDYEHNEDYEAYYNEEEEESAVYYSCDGEAVVQQGDNQMSSPDAHVQVMFDQEIYAPKILVSDNATGEILADMLIHTETEFQMSGDSCTWTGTDYTNNDPVDKTVTITFHDSEVAMQFYDSCETSKAATYSSTDPES